MKHESCSWLFPWPDISRFYFFSKIAKFKGAPFFKLLIHEIVAKVAKFCSGEGLNNKNYFFVLH